MDYSNLYLIWSRNDANRVRQVYRLVPNGKSFANEFPSILSSIQSRYLEKVGFNGSVNQTAKNSQEIVKMQHCKISARKSKERSKHSTSNENTATVDLSDYQCIFIRDKQNPISKIVSSFPVDDVIYDAFEFLTSKGFYLTDGSKFGGHFLAYQTDPIGSHSKWIVYVLHSTSSSGKCTLLHSKASFIRHARLATFVGKNFLIVFRHSTTGNFQFLQFQYSFCN